MADGSVASVPFRFHSDEAIIGLMARRYQPGQAYPCYSFYGQPYMGSLIPGWCQLLSAGSCGSERS